MKKILAHPIALLITVLFLAYISTIFLNFNSSVVSDGKGEYSSIVYSPDDTSFGELIYKPEINDSLPHYKYQHLTDSLIHLSEQRLQKNETFISGWRTGTIGVSEDNNQLSDKSVKSHAYFLTLQGFELDYHTKFFIENDQYKLMYVAWDTVSKKGESLRKRGTYKSVTIPVRYNANGKEIQIPISRTQYYVASVLMAMVAFILLTLSLFVMFGYPVQFLVRVSKGKAFTEKNINGLRMTTILISVYLLSSILLPFLIRLIFSKYIHPLFKPVNVYQLLLDKLIVLFVLAIVFAIYLAFRKGYKLQQEQDLTV